MDPFSAAASGISVASISIQIVESIHKLLRFCNSIKDAPDVIRSISADLEVLDEILNSLMMYHQDIQRRNDTSRLTIPKALISCLNQLHDLEQMISGLERGLGRRKTWTSVKAVLRNDAIKKFQSNLESGKASLILANQLFQNLIL